MQLDNLVSPYGGIVVVGVGSNPDGAQLVHLYLPNISGK